MAANNKAESTRSKVSARSKSKPDSTISSEGLVVMQEADVNAFPIVGIGCSAGGLSALERFFAHTPVDSGMGFVVIQHLAPVHESALPELLQRVTQMRVVEVRASMRILPNSVYVIPPNADLSVLHNTLHLLEPVQPRGLRLPIDFFLKTLADDCKEKSIGVILSGMGSDGIFGLKAIKEAAGLTLAQEPLSAGADSMPRGAIEAGLVDIIGLPEELPARIIAFLRHPVLTRAPERSEEPTSQSDLEKVIILLRDRSGADFSLYKTNTLFRRIERRVALHQMRGIADYVLYLRKNPSEVDLLFKELLIGVTRFFRDNEVWENLQKEVLPALLAEQPSGKTLRAWVPACSSGEEAYTLAIVFKEALGHVNPEMRFELLIYATDLDSDAIEKARKGFYPANIVSDITPERLVRYFSEEENGYRIKPEIRSMVVFATQNIISDPPFTRLDILSCRNLLIYFRAQLQKRIFPLFHYTMNRGGLLILGNAEALGNFGHLFDTANGKSHIYRRLNLLHTQVEYPARMPGRLHEPVAEAPATRAENIGELTDQLIQQNYAPAAVLVNGDGDILYISGRTGKYLEPAAGKFNMNIHAMAREGLREALTGVIQKALREPRPISLNALRVGSNGNTQIVNVTVHAIEKPEPLRGRVLIVFRDVVTPRRRNNSRTIALDAHEALANELQQAREALQVTHEGMQTAIEEQRSSNEELQSTNEELQSTNEELTTSKEEMQSLNEELHTVNAELQSKIANLIWMQNDMTNLLNSTEIATVFLDKNMNLRRFTPSATSLFKMIPGDVGRPLAHVMTDLDYQQLTEDSLKVLNTLAFLEKQIGTHDGRWYRVRVMPYRTQDNMIDGVVITFTDISEIVLLREQLENGLVKK